MLQITDLCCGYGDMTVKPDLKTIKGNKDTNDKIHKMITSLEKQNLYIVCSYRPSDNL